MNRLEESRQRDLIMNEFNQIFAKQNAGFDFSSSGTSNFHEEMELNLRPDKKLLKQKSDNEESKRVRPDVEEGKKNNE